MTVRIFVRSYLIERGTGKPGYRWVQGYNEVCPDTGNKFFLCVTRREAQRHCRADGEKAMFFDTDDEVTDFITGRAKHGGKNSQAVGPVEVDNGQSEDEHGTHEVSR